MKIGLSKGRTEFLLAWNLPVHFYMLIKDQVECDVVCLFVV